jgi:hypothetical protein
MGAKRELRVTPPPMRCSALTGSLPLVQESLARVVKGLRRWTRRYSSQRDEFHRGGSCSRWASRSFLASLSTLS